MMYRMALPLMALVVAGGCSGRDATRLMSPNEQRAVRDAAAPALSESFPRSGVLHLTKQCLEYTGLAGGFCTIRSSDLAEIEAGTTVFYTSAANTATGVVDSDLIYDTPGPGNNKVFGHAFVDGVNGVGVITLRGGTGKFTHFSADIVGTRIDRTQKLWSLVGTYSFDPKD